MAKMHRIFIAQDFKRMMEYKIDFLTGAVSFLINQAINIAFYGLSSARFQRLPDGALNRLYLFMVFL